MLKSYCKQARNNIREYILNEINDYMDNCDEYNQITERAENVLLLFFLEDYNACHYNDVTIPRYYKSYFERFKMHVMGGSCPFWEYPARQFDFICDWLQYTPEEKENARKQYGTDKIEDYFYKLLWRELTFLCNKNKINYIEYLKGVNEN
ncbi:MAG: hypothetical protein MJ066_05845 [Clostridia bacterium]|nr:hypothetical protein [Clostridia bacterium]